MLHIIKYKKFICKYAFGPFTMFVANYFGSILGLLDNVTFDFCVVCCKTIHATTRKLGLPKGDEG
jgi:hypothetical protein